MGAGLSGQGGVCGERVVCVRVAVIVCVGGRVTEGARGSERGGRCVWLCVAHVSDMT